MTQIRADLLSYVPIQLHHAPGGDRQGDELCLLCERQQSFAETAERGCHRRSSNISERPSNRQSLRDDPLQPQGAALRYARLDPDQDRELSIGGGTSLPVPPPTTQYCGATPCNRSGKPLTFARISVW